MNRYLLLVFCLFGWIQLNAQFPEQKLVPADIDPGDFFGRYLSIQNEDLFIGAHQDDVNGYASGSVYIFRLDELTGNFIEHQKIVPEDGDVEEFFGYSIDINDNFAIIGSHHDSDFGGSSGSAFILKRENDLWSIHKKILPSDPKAGDEFGKAVSMTANNLAIGSFLDDDQGTNSGSVYLFNFDEDDWIEYQEINPLDAEAYDQFGNFLSLEEDHLVVGVPEKKDKGDKSGCAYVFRNNADTVWTQAAKLLPEDISPGAQFGQAVHISANHIACGAYKLNNPLENGGAVYIYEQSGNDWNLIQKIIPPDNEEGDHFGNSVFLYEDILAVGAYFDDDNDSKSGSVYLYKRNGEKYDFNVKIITSDGGFGDAFGASVAIDGNFLVSGAYADSDNGFFSGSAYVYNIGELIPTHNTITKDIQVYPTIFKSGITIKGKGLSNEELTIELIDQKGQHIDSWKQKVNTQMTLLEHLESGWYYIKIKQGNAVSLARVFKSK